MKLIIPTLKIFVVAHEDLNNIFMISTPKLTHHTKLTTVACCVSENRNNQWRLINTSFNCIK